MTNGDVWKITVRRNPNHSIRIPYHASVKKIATNGRMIKNGNILTGGTFVGIQPENLALFYSESVFRENLRLEFPRKHSPDWGTSASGQVVAIFGRKKEAVECSKESDLTKNDLRWTDTTERIVKLIGLDHPFFCIPVGILHSFNNCDNLGPVPKKRRILEMETELIEPKETKENTPRLPSLLLPKPKKGPSTRTVVVRGVTLVESTKKAAKQPLKVIIPIKTPQANIKTDGIESIPQSTHLFLTKSDVLPGKEIWLIVRRNLRLHRILPSVDRNDFLTIRPDEDDETVRKHLLEETIQDGVNYYCKTTIAGVYGMSVGDIMTICKVEKTEASTTLTYMCKQSQ